MTGGYPDAILSLQSLAAYSEATDASVALRLDTVGFVPLSGRCPRWSAALSFAVAVNCRDVLGVAAHLSSDVRYQSPQRHRSRAGRAVTVRWLASVVET